MRYWAWSFRGALMLLCTVLYAGTLHAGNVVLEWNETMLAALKKDTNPPLLVARSLAIMHLAIWDAQKSSAPESAEVAAATAAFTAAIALLPSHRAEFEELRNRHFTARGDAAKLRDVFELGEAATRRVLAERVNDGSTAHISYIPRKDPGQWRRTPPFFRPPELPHWAAKVTPFVLKRADALRPAGPPALSSAKWATAMNELKVFGGQNSQTRTDAQMRIARFWSDFSYTETPTGHWNSIARAIAADRNLSFADSARLFAMLNVILADAGIACWDAKYHYNFWRPVTAIHRASEDNNDATEPDETWTPLLNTPPHPEYPSGHSTFSGAAITVISSFLGTDAINFTVRSDALPSVERKFTSLRACAEECGLSRIYGGIHYRFSCEDGMELGQRVAESVLRAFH